MANTIKRVETSDGSSTLFHPEIGEHYHSRHGAVQESRHVFVEMGLEYLLSQTPNSEVSVLEVGFGTGLNFILSAAFARSREVQLNYHGIEAHPLPLETIRQMGYEAYVPEQLWAEFLSIYEAAMQTPQQMGLDTLSIAHRTVLDFRSPLLYDVVYFDAFAAIHQPDMWTEQTLAHVCSFLKAGGIFVTYAITGNLKRTMKSLGFDIEKVPGAPGKREMLRARKREVVGLGVR